MYKIDVIDILFIIFMIISISLLVFLFSDPRFRVNSFKGTVIDKFITSSRYGSPCFYIVIDTNGDTINRQVNPDDYYNGYFIGDTYEFE